MSRSIFRATVGGLLAQSEDDLTMIRLFKPSHTSKDNIVRLARVPTKYRTVVHNSSVEVEAIELDRIPSSDAAELPQQAVEPKPSNTSTSSDDSNQAVSPVFTSRQGSKRSSISTSILQVDEQPPHTEVPAILLDDKPLDLACLDEGSCFPVRKGRRERLAFNDSDEEFLTVPRKRPWQRESKGESSPRPSVPAIIDWFRLPAITFAHIAPAKQPLTTALLTFLAPTLIKWRLLTFYGPFSPVSLQRRVAEDAHSCLALKASRISSVDWSETWERVQRQRRCGCSGRWFKGWLYARFSTQSDWYGGEKVLDVVHAAAAELNISATQLELAIQAVALAFDPKARGLSALALTEMKEWSTLAKILLGDGEVLVDAPIAPRLLKPAAEPAPAYRGRRRAVYRKDKGKGKGKERASDDGENLQMTLTLQQPNAWVDLDSVLPELLAAHKGCKERYFRAVEWEEKGKVGYKLSADEEGDLEGMEELGREMRGTWEFRIGLGSDYVKDGSKAGKSTSRTL